MEGERGGGGGGQYGEATGLGGKQTRPGKGSGFAATVSAES